MHSDLCSPNDILLKSFSEKNIKIPQPSWAEREGPLFMMGRCGVREGDWSTK